MWKKSIAAGEQLTVLVLVSGQTGDKAGAWGLLVVNKTHTLPVMMINISRKHIPEKTQAGPVCYTAWEI